MKYELRQQNNTAPVSVEGKTLSGYAIVWNSDSRDLGGFTERFLPGSVTESVRSNTITAVAHHDDSMPLGAQHDGTLRLREDAKGLSYEIDLPDASYARDLASLMTEQRKTIGGTSFSFSTPPGGDVWKRQDGKNIREVRKATLGHISPVAVAAYPETTAFLRSLSGETETLNIVDIYGIDLEKLAAIFLASNKGLRSIQPEEIELARKAMVALQAATCSPRLDAANVRAANILI